MPIDRVSSASATLQTQLEIGQRPGLFFDLSPLGLRRLHRLGYRAMGVAAVLLNSNGQIVLGTHKGNEKLPDGIQGITSETTGGYLDETRVIAERTIVTIGRCLKTELDQDISSIRLSTRLTDNYALTDWPVSTDPDRGKLLGINVALLMDEATEEKVLNARDTKEMHRVHMVDPQEVLQGAISFIRPGTQQCLRALEVQGLLDPSQLTDVSLVFPECPEPEFDIDLSKVR